MHELALCQNLLALMLRQAAQAEEFPPGATAAGATRPILRAVVQVGALSGVEAGALAFCYPAVCRGSAAQGSQLEIIRVEGQGRCPACGQLFAMESLAVPCPHCGAWGAKPTQGAELKLVGLTLGPPPGPSSGP